MATLNLPFILEQLDLLIDNEVYEQTDRGSEKELILLTHIQTTVTSHLAERLANAGPNFVADEPELEAEEVVEDEEETAS